MPCQKILSRNIKLPDGALPIIEIAVLNFYGPLIMEIELVIGMKKLLRPSVQLPLGKRAFKLQGF